jgi:hypothetical protein
MNSKTQLISLSLGALALLPFCGTEHVGSTMDSQTHWLDECTSDAQCGDLECICGRCVARCEASGSCDVAGLQTECTARTSVAVDALCGPEDPASSVCLVPCDSDVDCSGDQQCIGERCVVKHLSPPDASAPEEGGTVTPPPDGAPPDSAPPEGGSTVPTTPTEWGRGTPTAGLTYTGRLDVLLVVDNSISMSDKQHVLSVTVPDMMSNLASRGIDLHVGAISTRFGDFQQVCRETEDDNDHGHLIGTRPRAAGLGLTEGFASWRPGDDINALHTSVQGLVTMAGEFGCGYEQTLEAWYRFLVDPAPPLTFEYRPCSAQNPAPCVFGSGIDNELLAQRAAFLRPDSAVAVVILSDENDCSIRNEGQMAYIADPGFPVPSGSTVCATNPNDPCCYNCALGVPQGCGVDPACAGNPPAQPDPPNLRCFEQKRRFGVEFLYPIERYVAGLTNAEVWNGNGFAPNPLYASGGAGRDRSIVFLAGIVGVPWQDIATSLDANDQPLPPGQLRYLPANELTWDTILGSPQASPPVPPLDPLMVESIAPRLGTSPVTAESLQPPSAGYLANTINGHEWANPDGDDLQYACIFPLGYPRNCENLANPDQGCDCKVNDVSGDLNPLCQAPGGQYSTTQGFAKAYPAGRHIELLSKLGNQAVLASICARNVTDSAQSDFGYRPAVNALMERLNAVLPAP